VSGDLVIDRRHMPDKEYIKTETKKEYIFLHHTAGWDNPYNVIHGWATDTRGRVGTQYVIGGQNVTNVSHKYDGVIVEAFPKEYYAYHLGIGATYMHSRSVGIELCNFGYLTKEGTKFYTYTKREVHPSQVVTLKKDFRGFRHFHRYSDNQISALKKLLIKISNDHSIDLKGGLYTYFNSQDPFVALDYKDDVKKGLVKGVFSHTNVIMSGKWDIFPQDEMIDMIRSI
jgi:N-acetyl-anhydromuramyl-L-alanine amidase AmpD